MNRISLKNANNQVPGAGWPHISLLLMHQVHHDAEGHGFNRAVKSRAKGPYRSAEGRSEGVAATTELPSSAEAAQA